MNADAFAPSTKEQVIQMIREDLGQVDLIVYSLASPRRVMPMVPSTIRAETDWQPLQQ